MQHFKINKGLIKTFWNDKRFRRVLDQPLKFDFKHTIPYLCGYSRNGRVIYFDRDLPKFWKYKGRQIYLADILAVHEKVEKTLIDLFHMRYQQAHHYATHFEAMACELNNINWWAYSKFLNPYIKSVYHEKLSNVPKDLDETPYIDEHERKILRLLKAGGDRQTINNEKQSMRVRKHRR